MRTRILDATVACIGRFGIAKTTVDDSAREAGLSRATLYRYFPDGRDDLIAAAIGRAVEVFFHDLFDAVAAEPDLAVLLEHAIFRAHRAVGEHEVLQKVLETEPERLLPQLSQSSAMMLDGVRDFLARRLATERLRPGVDVEIAADWLARVGVSFIVAEGMWDLADEADVRRLVRDELLRPILAV